MSAGKLMKEPPPASAFIAPESIPAEKIKIIVFMEAMLLAASRSHNLAIPVLDFGNSESKRPW